LTEEFVVGTVKLDKTDQQLINLLQLNARMTMKEIATAIDKGITTVHNRMKALEAANIITGYTAVVDGAKIGRPTVSMVLVRVRYRVPGRKDMLSQREFCLEIAEHPYVQSVHVLSGEWDVLMKVRTKDVDEMNSFIVDFLRQLPAVDRTLTMFVMDTYLDTNQIRIGEKLPKVKK
jgi:DNA-binding Lrp family transcriptional regulator